MSDREVQDGAASGGSLEPLGPDVLLRTVVAPYRLGEVLLRIAELKLTGRLALASDMGRRTILFHSGLPVFTQSSLFAERLGAIGVRHGFFGRQDVARALAHAREREHGLGESLLDLGYVDPGRLHALLGVQLREVVAAACGSGAQRARFQSGGAPLRDAVILRLHPMTAALTAMAGLPASEQRKLLATIASRRLGCTPVPAIVQSWLSDLGYLGDGELLLQGEPSVDAVRSRLLARYRADAERAFDPTQVAFAFAGARVLVEPRSAARIAELVTLTLLMSGALKFADAGAAPDGARGEPLPNTADGLLLALEQAVERPAAEARAGAAAAETNALDQAIEAYLYAKPERSVALEAAVWGPSAEARDGNVPPELMHMYLALKSEKRPEVVLGVAAGAAPEQVMQAYARRTGMVASVEPSASAHLRCRAAELAQRFDDALDALLPGGARASLPPPGQLAPSDAAAAARPRASVPPAAGDTAARGSVPPRASARASVPPRASAPPPSEASTGAPAAAPPAERREPSEAGLQLPRGETRSARADALAAKVDGLMRAGHWRSVLDTLEGQPSTKLSFTLQLARAMAQRELEGRRAGRRWLWIAALLAGVAIGYLLRHFDVLLPRLPF